jgi:hypothetical protein
MARKYCVNFTLRYYKNARQKREGNSARNVGLLPAYEFA